MMAVNSFLHTSNKVDRTTIKVGRFGYLKRFASIRLFPGLLDGCWPGQAMKLCGLPINSILAGSPSLL